MTNDALRRCAQVCLLASLAVVPLAPLLPVDGAPIAVKQLLLLGFGSLGALALWCLARRGESTPALGTPVDAALLLWLAVTAAAACWASRPGLAAYGLGLELAWLLLYLLAVKTLRRPRHVRTACLAVAAPSLVIACLGLLGYARFLADDASETARAAYLSTSLFPHSYLAAQYLVMVFVGGLVLVLEAGARRWRLGLALGLVPVGAYLFVIGSRGAYLVLVATAVGSMVLRGVSRPSPDANGRRRLARLAWRGGVALSVLLLAALALSLAGPLSGAAQFAFDRLAMLFDPSRSQFNYSRLDVWRDSLDMVADHMLLGVGPGHFETMLPTYHAGEASVPHAHNQFVHVLAESGVAGLAAFLLLVRQARRTSVRAAAHLAGDEQRRALFHAAVAALLAGLLYFLWETPLLWAEAGSLMVVALAIASRAGCDTREAPTRPLVANATVALVLAGLAVVLPATLAYQRHTRLAAAADEEEHAAARATSEEQRQLHLERAVAALAESDAAFPYGPKMLAWSAQLLAQLGRLEDALAVWREADARSPGTYNANSAIGALELRAGRPQAAIEPLRRAVIAHLGPESAATYVRLAQAYLRSGQHEEAWACYLTLVQQFHFQTVQPSILIEACRALVNLQRLPLFAGRLLKIYAELRPTETGQPGYTQMLEAVAEMRDRPPRVSHY